MGVTSISVYRSSKHTSSCTRLLPQASNVSVKLNTEHVHESLYTELPQSLHVPFLTRSLVAAARRPRRAAAACSARGAPALPGPGQSHGPAGSRRCTPAAPGGPTPAARNAAARPRRRRPPGPRPSAPACDTAPAARSGHCPCTACACT